VHLRDSPFEARQGVAGDGSVTLALAGDLDLCTSAALASKLDGISAGHPRQVIFDMSQVSYADLGTLRALVTGGGQDAPPPVLCHPPPVVIRLLEVSGLAEHCIIVRLPASPGVSQATAVRWSAGAAPRTTGGAGHARAASAPRRIRPRPTTLRPARPWPIAAGPPTSRWAAVRSSHCAS
jgi:anti-anti-sigma factor